MTKLIINNISTIEVKIGNIAIGAGNPIRLQSMTNIATYDIEGSVLQAKKIFDAGADFVRISTPKNVDVENLQKIKTILHKDGYTKPLIADVHFNPNIAESAAKIVEKVRINPGNYIDKRASFKKLEFSDFEYREELEKMHNRLLPLIKICKEYGTAIRIGSNHGSLSDRILTRYGNTVEGMVEAAMEFIDIFISENFYNLVISMKASDTRIMTQSCRLLNEKMIEKGYVFPQHLGVTEAGADTDGRLKSAIGIGTLLNDGIGDTVRVSLTENPENEIYFAKKLLAQINRNTSSEIISAQEKISFNTLKFKHVFNQQYFIISEKENADIIYFNEKTHLDKQKKYLTEYRNWKNGFINNNNIFPLLNISDIENIKIDKNINYFLCLSIDDISSAKVLQVLELENIYPILTLSNNFPLCELRSFYAQTQHINKSGLVIKHKLKSIDYNSIIAEIGVLGGSCLVNGLATGIWFTAADNNTNIDLSQIEFDLLQAAGLRISKAEFISCPGCGRTNYNLEKLTQEVKKEFSHLKGLKIAVMGCVVNGPGEMADADYGCVGAGKNMVHIYKGKTPVIKNVPQDEAVEKLRTVING